MSPEETTQNILSVVGSGGCKPFSSCANINEEWGTYTEQEFAEVGIIDTVAQAYSFETRRHVERLDVTRINCSPKHREGMLYWIDSSQNLAELKVALKNIETLKEIGFLNKPVEPDEDEDEDDNEDFELVEPFAGEVKLREGQESVLVAVPHDALARTEFDLRPIGPGEELTAMMDETTIEQRVFRNTSRPQGSTAVLDSSDLPDLAENHFDTTDQCAVRLPNWGGRCPKSSRWRVSNVEGEKLIYCCTEHLSNVRRPGDVMEEVK